MIKMTALNSNTIKCFPYPSWIAASTPRQIRAEWSEEKVNWVSDYDAVVRRHQERDYHAGEPNTLGRGIIFINETKNSNEQFNFSQNPQKNYSQQE